MSLEDDLHQAMIGVYYRAADETGYRGTRYLQAVRRNGGLATAKRMLKPRTKAQRAGLDRILEAGKPDLTFEAVVLEPRFRSLFTEAELAEAATRLGRFVDGAKKARRQRERLYPDDLEPGRTYTEGAKRQVRVNAYERDPRARKACIAHHRCLCAVCDLSFEERYGSIGKGFIHVHHLRPLAEKGRPEAVDPTKDLVPVCPNCHAMLHRMDPPLTVEALRQLLASAV
jgi:5-methylcytosine-specific restriction enzyme A